MRLTLGLLIAVLLAGAAFPATLSQGERDRTMSYLHANRKMLLDAAAGLSEAQWNFRPAPGRWSVADCVEHIVLTERSLFGMVTGKILQSPPASAELRAKAEGNDERILQGIRDRSNKAQAPESLQPTRRWATRDEALAEFRKIHDEIIRFIETTPEDLRAHVTPSQLFGAMDAYQWMLFLSAHTDRHLAQIREVMADPNFPK